jgi:hypothetical protein
VGEWREMRRGRLEGGISSSCKAITCIPFLPA